MRQPREVWTADDAQRAVGVVRPHLLGEGSTRDRRMVPLTGRDHVARDKRTSVRPAPRAHEVGRHRTEPAIADDAATDCDVRPGTGPAAGEGNLVPGRELDRGPHGDRGAEVTS